MLRAQPKVMAMIVPAHSTRRWNGEWVFKRERIRAWPMPTQVVKPLFHLHLRDCVALRHPVKDIRELRPTLLEPLAAPLQRLGVLSLVRELVETFDGLPDGDV